MFSTPSLIILTLYTRAVGDDEISISTTTAVQVISDQKVKHQPFDHQIQPVSRADRRIQNRRPAYISRL